MPSIGLTCALHSRSIESWLALALKVTSLWHQDAVGIHVAVGLSVHQVLAWVDALGLAGL